MSQERSETTRPSRDWIQISVTALPGLAAVIALIFTWLSINATNIQLQITQQGQITDRYNAAITNLGSSSEEVRLGGIYALQRIMQDSPRDQPTIVAVLCAFIRDHRKITTPKPPTISRPSLVTGPSRLPTDIQAALSVVDTRNTAHDGSTTFVDLSQANLSGANLNGASLPGAFLSGVDLSGALLSHADLSGADLSGADLANAYLLGANLNDALLPGASLPGAFLDGALLSGALLSHADLSGADLSGANLTGADLSRVKGLPAGRPLFPPKCVPEIISDSL